ncbi:MAG TPA: cobalamin-independent methionine synthase II family protein [Chloroflexota bacterium]|jgi:5-methyltetrahydropteroyltriglutamate--homocysteine methyltransferase|nr:cobalamin-independent methionine synthase II family protein [Chloroflexota bacterium]
MKRSTERILTTHTGSLARSPELVDMIQRREAGEAIDARLFAETVRNEVADTVRKQVEVGIDVVSDGELGKPSFASYVADRIAGFGEINTNPRTSKDWEVFTEWSRDRPRPNIGRRWVDGPIEWRGDNQVRTDLENLEAAMSGASAEEAFIPSASIGIIADVMANRHYPSEEAYLFALAEAMHHEYKAITDAGYLLQIDAPDAAMGRHMQFRNDSLEDFRKATDMRVEALNHALEGIPEEQIRYHICWGNNEAPHVHDVPLADIIDLVLKVRAGAYSIEASNPRHAHEWRLWESVRLPEGKVLIPGVIDSTTNFVEHPELVAERIERFAQLVGRENVIAGTDCGFGTSAGRDRVHPEIIWHKLHALAEGAEIASKRLWR